MLKNFVLSPSYEQNIRRKIDEVERRRKSKEDEEKRRKLEPEKGKESQPPSKNQVPALSQAPTQTTVSMHGSDKGSVRETRRVERKEGEAVFSAVEGVTGGETSGYIVEKGRKHQKMKGMQH